MPGTATGFWASGNVTGPVAPAVRRAGDEEEPGVLVEGLVRVVGAHVEDGPVGQDDGQVGQVCSLFPVGTATTGSENVAPPSAEYAMRPSPVYA